MRQTFVALCWLEVASAAVAMDSAGASSSSASVAEKLVVEKPKKAQLIPHEKHLWTIMSNVWMDDRFHTLAFHTLSGESWRLTSASAVKLGFNGDGHCWLKSGGSSAWLWAKCQYLALADEGKRFVQKGDDLATRTLLSEDMCSHRPCTLSVVSLVRGYGDVSISGAAFSSPAMGAFCFWNLGDVFKNFEMDNRGVASRWMLDRWNGWVSALEREYGLGSGHFRKAKPTKHLAQAQSSDAYRVLSFNSVSTHCLLALLCRWTHSGSEQAGLINNMNGRAKLGSFLESWLRDAKMNVDVFIYTSDECTWHPPLVPTGGRRVLVPVRQGLVDVRPLHIAKAGLMQQASGGWEHWFCRCWRVDSETHYMELHEFVPWLMANNGIRILRQVLWYVGTALDLHVAYLHWPGKRSVLGAHLDGDFHLLAEAQGEEDRGIKRKAGANDTWRHRDERLCEYWLTGRKYWARSDRQLSMAFDFSRVGGKNCGVMMLCSADNVGHWMPPQACCIYSAYGLLTRFRVGGPHGLHSYACRCM